MSIALVLAGHLAPLGAGPIQLNFAVAATGMALFFILSGFLITRSLMSGVTLQSFFIRRIFRIVPLAWAAMFLLLLVNNSSFEEWLANLLFYANLPPQKLVYGGSHLWSLCVEVHIYIALAVIVGIFRKWSSIIIPVIALIITGARVYYARYDDIVTWFRCDEILAGGILALIYGGHFGERIGEILSRINPLIVLPVLIASAHPAFGPLNYVRPYLAAVTIGASIYNSPAVLIRISGYAAVTYTARISYALYIVHGALMDSWLGAGDKIVKYAKRPLLLGATFGLAHISTFKFEEPMTRFAKRITNRHRSGV